jgi:sulfate transport system ATP-binding protein
MGFLGPVTRLGGELVRPHDIDVSADRVPQAHEAIVERLVSLGFQTRLDATLTDGQPVSVQLTRAQAQELDVGTGDIVFLRAPRPAVRRAETDARPPATVPAARPGPAAT